jgi:Xaa-Pro aminopeptidase
MSLALSLDACRQRQARLCERLAAEKLDAALLMDLRHIYYLSGFWRVGRVLTPAALLLRADGSSALVAPAPVEETPAADRVATYEADRLATLIDDFHAELFQSLQPHLQGIQRLGTDGVPRSLPLEGAESRAITPLLRALRRTKDPDEVAMLQRAVGGAEAAYARAKAMLEPGVTEVQLYAGMLSAAIEALGEPLTEFGNDFQCNAAGGPPRDRPVQTGELAIFDLGVVYRAYSSDLSRTFVVGRQPSEAQQAAYQRILEAFAYIESAIRPGVRCKAVYAEVHRMLDGHRGWSFPHHLGHGIGLSAHEAPRLNPNWDDTFQAGDVFTAEPGLYGDDLRAGIRIEQNYLVTPTGLQRLSHFPTDLA